MSNLKKRILIFTTILCMILMPLTITVKGKGQGQVDRPQSGSRGNIGNVEVIVNGLEERTEGNKGITITLNREGIKQTATTDYEGKAIFSNVKYSGDITLSVEEVVGYITPSSKKIEVTGKNKYVKETFTYIKMEIIPVEGVKIKYNEEEVGEDGVDLVSGDSIYLTAEVLPVNATNKNVTWESSDDAIAKVSDDGIVYGLRQGTTTVTVTTDDGGLTDRCIVNVGVVTGIVELEDPAPITVPLNAVVQLPESVKATLDNNEIKYVPVTWNPSIVDTSVAGTIELIGSVDGTDITVKLIVTVEDNVAILPTGIKLDQTNISLTIQGDNYGFTQLTATVEPENAYVKSIIWSSDNEQVAKVDANGLVTAEGAGQAIITARIEDTDYKAFCSVSVAIDGSPLETDTQIFGALSDGTQTEEFENKEDVYIVGKNLPISKYYVKVEAKGKGGALGDGTIEASDIDNEGYVMFNLFEVTNFKLTNKNSNEYFVYMSTESDFPKDEDKTLKTNFKIEKAVPTGNIMVTTTFVGGDRTDKSGVKFILGRVLYEGDEDKETTEQYIDYVNATTSNGYTDEVKAWGITDAEGKIEGLEIWDGSSEIEPGKWYTKEILKIGGYMLLQEPIEGYKNNLDEVNPMTDDGSLLKEVYITRDGIETRDVVNIYVGSSGDQ